jgi:hypothetical protein
MQKNKKILHFRTKFNKNPFNTYIKLNIGYIQRDECEDGDGGENMYFHLLVMMLCDLVDGW